MRKNLEGAELDLQFDFKIGASVVFFTSTGTLSLAKTSQPIFIDSYEGQEVNISCNHTTIATSDNIFWYRQFPNQGPQYIIHGYKTNVENEVASLLIPPDRKFSTLSLPQASLRDTAVYYCIVGEAHCDRWGCTCAVSLVGRWGGRVGGAVTRANLELKESQKAVRDEENEGKGKGRRWIKKRRERGQGIST